MNQNTKDIISGFISGWVQVILMQPFEIVKVRLQSQSAGGVTHYKNGFDCFKKIAFEEGPLAFYKGTMSPLIGVGFYNSAAFFTYQYSKRFFKRFKQNPEDLLPMKYVILSGMTTGLPGALIIGPVEHARIRIQIQKGSEGGVYKGSVDAALKIVKNHGVKGLMKGFYATWGRQTFGQACFFGAYEATIRTIVGPNQKPTEAPLIYSLFAGAIGGLAYWVLGYPWDVIKTLMQADSIQNPRYKTMRDAFKQQAKTGNFFKSFYTGINVVFGRAIFAGSGTFFAFQATSRFLGRTEVS